MDMVVTAGAIRRAKLQYHQQTNTQLFTDWMFFWFGLQPSMCQSRSKSAQKCTQYTTICVCKILSGSVEIWKYEDQ